MSKYDFKLLEGHFVLTPDIEKYNYETSNYMYI